MTLKTVLGSNHNEDNFRSLVTKHRRRMVPKPKLLVSVRRTKTRTLETVWSSSPNEDVSHVLQLMKTEHG
jgi:hypothetical protein